MARNVRNFWVELNVDGKQRPVASGPRNKDGGFYLDVKVRRDGEPLYVGSLTGSVIPGGKLRLSWVPSEVELPATVLSETKR